jgi:hypothetical protein
MICGALLGGFYAGFAWALLRPGASMAAPLVFESSVAGAALGALSMQAVRWATRGSGRDASRVLALTLGLLVLAVLLARVVNEWAGPILFLAALLSLTHDGPGAGAPAVRPLDRRAEG